MKNLNWTVISALTALALGACSGGADPSPTDEPQQVGSSAQPVDLAPAASAASDGSKHCDGKGHMDPAAFEKRFDKNGDGKLELSELPPRMQQWLAKADTNNDGVLSVEELTAAKESGEKAHFARIDKNGDGSLTEAEVGEKRWARLSAADADKNGAVTEAELEQAIAAGIVTFPHHHRFHESDPAPATTGS